MNAWIAVALIAVSANFGFAVGWAFGRGRVKSVVTGFGRMNRRSFLRCLPAAPAALSAVPAAALQIGQTDESEEREVLAVCETCERKLFEGDLVHACWDGPDFCESCAPTWLDLKAEQDEMIARGDFADHFEDGEEAAHRARDCVLSQIIAGNGAKKHVWRL